MVRNGDGFLEWGDINAILHGLEHSLHTHGQDYRFSAPQQEGRKVQEQFAQGHGCPSNGVVQDVAGACVPAPVRRDEGGMYCGSFSKGLVEVEAFTILLEETPELGKTAEDDDVKTDDKEGLGGAVS